MKIFPLSDFPIEPRRKEADFPFHFWVNPEKYITHWILPTAHWRFQIRFQIKVFYTKLVFHFPIHIIDSKDRIFFYLLFDWDFAESCQKRHELSKLWWILAVLCDPTLEISDKALALCGYTFIDHLVGLFVRFQLVVCVIGAVVWVWFCLVQPFLCWEECSSNFWAPNLVPLVWFQDVWFDVDWSDG